MQMTHCKEELGGLNMELSSFGQVRNRGVLGILWFILSLLVGIANDGVTKYLGQALHPIEVTFFRFLFSTVTLLPLMLTQGKQSFYTVRLGLHICRGGILFLSIALWCYGLSLAPISLATVINFTIPFFTLVLAAVFLKEKVGAARWLATLVGFGGVVVVLQPGHVAFNPHLLLLLLASLLFAGLDILNKRFVTQEGIKVMLFYTGLFTMLFGAAGTCFVWETPSLFQLGLLALLGCGANLLLYCLLKGFEYADASALAPFRYVELLFSAAMGYLVFAERPSPFTWLGAAIIIPSALVLGYIEMKRPRGLQF